MSSTQTRTSSVTLTKAQAQVIISAINRDYARENNRRQMFERKAKQYNAQGRLDDVMVKNAADSIARMTRLEEAHKAISEVAR